jgi:citryl-CoA synthetase large subunit
MKLKEFESKKILGSNGFVISSGIVVKSLDEFDGLDISYPKMFKAQCVSNGRAKAGGVFVVEDALVAREAVVRFLGSEFLGEKISEVMFDELVEISHEFYLGVLFDVSKRCPVLIFSNKGGVDIEKVKIESPNSIVMVDINYLDGVRDEDILKMFSLCENVDFDEFKDVVLKLYSAFVKFDLRMIEVNPLVLSKGGKLVGVDCVCVTDQDADFRREIKFEDRTNSRVATAREIAARQIDKDDHRGVAGKTFIDLDGDIGILTVGGGASMTLMDSLIEFGGKPANFTEYSGNPPMEKVEKLTRIVLDRDGLSGLFIGGVIANFTNIRDTIQGTLNVLIEKKVPFPVVIRRAGPFDDEAKKLVDEVCSKYGLDISFYDEKIALSEASKIMVEKSNEYKRKIRGGI